MDSFLNGLLGCDTVISKVDGAGQPVEKKRQVNGGAWGAKILKTTIIGGVLVGCVPPIGDKDKE